MRRATFVLAVAVVIGLFTTRTFAQDVHLRTTIGGDADVLMVGHPSPYHRHGGYATSRYHGHSYHRGYPYGVSPYGHRPPMYGPPAVVYPYPGYPPIVRPPVYPRHRHVCGPGCGCGGSSGFYYRGPGWGFSFSF